MNKLGFRGFTAAAIVIYVLSVQTGMAQQQAQGATPSGNPVLTGQPEPPPAVLRPALRGDPQIVPTGGARGPLRAPGGQARLGATGLRRYTACSRYVHVPQFLEGQGFVDGSDTIAATRRDRWSRRCRRVGIFGIYGPPQICKRKIEMTVWSAPMDSVFGGIQDSGT